MRKRSLLLIGITLVLMAALSLTMACAQPAPAPSPSPAPAPKPSPAPAPAPAPPPTAPAVKAVELKIWSAWIATAWTTKPYMHWFLDKVAKDPESKAVGITFKYVGGPEVFPATEGMDALRKGLVDAAFTTTAYHVGVVPEGDAMKLSKLQPWEERTSGAYEMLNKIHQEKANAFYSWRLPHDGYFTFYLNLDRASPDMKGLKIRTTPIYTALIKALGGTPVNMAIDEIYTGLERKIVDGFGYTSVGLADRKLEEVTKYKWGPPFYTSPTGVWYNMDRWKSLDQKQRDFLTRMATEAEKEAYTMWQGDLKGEADVRAKAKITDIKFSAADEKTFLDMAYEEGWKDVLSKTQGAAQLRPAMEKK